MLDRSMLESWVEVNRRPCVLFSIGSNALMESSFPLLLHPLGNGVAGYNRRGLLGALRFSSEFTIQVFRQWHMEIVQSFFHGTPPAMKLWQKYGH
jgi:hypothetical protein